MRPTSNGSHRSPVPAIIADLSAALLVFLAAIVAAQGRIRFRFAGLRISVSSPWWPVLTAVLLVALRHWWLSYRGLSGFAPDPQPVTPSRRFLAGALLLLTVLTAVGTYPQILHLR